jgi:hypothetical protein
VAQIAKTLHMGERTIRKYRDLAERPSHRTASNSCEPS